MKCHICNNETTWNESFGRETFIVCPICHRRITEKIKILKKHNFPPEVSALEIILEIGYIKEERR